MVRRVPHLPAIQMKKKFNPLGGGGLLLPWACLLRWKVAAFGTRNCWWDYLTAQQAGVMKIKAVFEGILAGVVLGILSYFVFVSPATVAAIAIRHKMPDAWFSGLVVWYATFVVIGVSIVIAGVACWMVYKRVLRSTPKS